MGSRTVDLHCKGACDADASLAVTSSHIQLVCPYAVGFHCHVFCGDKNAMQ